MSKLQSAWERHFLRFEFVLAVVLGVTFVFWGEPLLSTAGLAPSSLDARRTIYGALASLFGSLLGFVITAVSIAIAFASSDRLSIVRESRHYGDLWRVFTASIKSLGLATVVALVGLVADGKPWTSAAIGYLMFFSSVLATFRVIRCVWVLEKIVGLVTAPSKATRMS